MKKAKVFFIMTVLFLFSVLHISAATYLTWWSKTPFVRVRDYTNNYNDTWINVLNNGRSSWNNSSAKVTLTTDNASNNRIYVQSYNDEWYGVTTALSKESGKYLTLFDIKINAKTISRDASNFNNFARSTIAHEIGHVFWLDDNPSSGNKSLMNHSRNRETIYVPQSSDIANVNAKY